MLTPRQKEAVEARGSVAVTAGAGSGKTFLLTERYVHLVKQGLSPLEIVATTFTRKAAAELKSRIRTRMQTSEFSAEVLAELEASQIDTLHSLASRICHEHPLEAEQPAEFSIMEDIDERLFRAAHLDNAMAQITEECFAFFSYSMLKEIIEVLLYDPLTAELALAKGSSHWADLARQTREKARQDLLTDLAPHKHTLRAHQGPPSDAREEARQIALNCITQIELGETTAYDTALAIKLTGGSKKQWGEEAFTNVGIAVTALRNGVKFKQKQLRLELGEADALLDKSLPALKAAYKAVKDYLAKMRYRNRVLDFAHLEVHALRALSHAHVRVHYQSRWKAFLIDELQDTNPVQAEIVRLLTEGSSLTVVGDAKQSIYGFRRADVEVFSRFRQEIETSGGNIVVLDTSFRTHSQLLTPLNELTVFLGDLFEPLQASRKLAPGVGPHIEAYRLADPPDRREAQLEHEARLIALRVQAFLDKGSLIHDKGQDHPIKAKDIAVLAATKAPLYVYADALNALGIDAVLSDTDDLLATREAQDGMAFLRFLADPKDDLALLALLRSPFFALRDSTLQTLAKQKAKDQSWWNYLEGVEEESISSVKNVLTDLVEKRKRLPTELFDLMEKQTAYPAILAHLTNGERRLADYYAFIALVRRLEADTHSAFSVWRELRSFMHKEVSIARPTVATGNAVTLMNTHKAKGLEWPVVFAADLGQAYYLPTSSLYFTSQLGLGLQMDAQTKDKANPVVYEALKGEMQRRELLEKKRLLYVALTRARDYLVLTTSVEGKGSGKSAYDELRYDFRPVPLEKLAL